MLLLKEQCRKICVSPFFMILAHRGPLFYFCIGLDSQKTLLAQKKSAVYLILLSYSKRWEWHMVVKNDLCNFSIFFPPIKRGMVSQNFYNVFYNYSTFGPNIHGLNHFCVEAQSLEDISWSFFILEITRHSFIWHRGFRADFCHDLWKLFERDS